MPNHPLISGFTRTELARITNAIYWERTNESVVSFASWNSQQKQDLEQALDLILTGHTLGLPSAPPLSVNFSLSSFAWTCLSPRNAWRYFVGYVAQSLAFEHALRSLREPSWSIKTYSASELQLLFDSRSLFKWYPVVNAYVIDPDYILGSVTPGDPVRTFRFLQQSRLLGFTSRQTICRILEWCRSHLVHFSGQPIIENVLDYWQYAGLPPVERIISGTVRSSEQQQGAKHWTMGCHGTTGFLRTVLRTANIPVEQVKRCKHALPHFIKERNYLSHGDDPYGMLSEATPAIPIGDILINAAKFERWFGSAVSETDVCNNVGRRPFELAIAYLPNFLLLSHCSDLTEGLNHANSTVLTIFERTYTLAELEATGLWERMDIKIAAMGGCANVPPVSYGT